MLGNIETSEGDRLISPDRWHTRIRQLPGLHADDGDAFMTTEAFLEPYDTLVALISIQDDKGWRNLPRGTYLVTDIGKDDADEVMMGDPRVGYVMNWVAKVLSEGHKSMTVTDIPANIRTAGSLPAGARVDMDNAFNLRELNGKLAGYPIYEIAPVALSRFAEAMRHSNSIHVIKDIPTV